MQLQHTLRKPHRLQYLVKSRLVFPREQAYAFAVERMASASLLPDAQEGISAFLEEFPPNHR
jgi:hypothetical protein